MTAYAYSAASSWTSTCQLALITKPHHEGLFPDKYDRSQTPKSGCAVNSCCSVQFISEHAAAHTAAVKQHEAAVMAAKATHEAAVAAAQEVWQQQQTDLEQQYQQQMAAAMQQHTDRVQQVGRGGLAAQPNRN